MNEREICKSTLESVFENGNDACFTTLFWFAVGGLPGALAHRLVNTLDAMWGYRTPQFLYFGWAAAKPGITTAPTAARPSPPARVHWRCC